MMKKMLLRTVSAVLCLCLMGSVLAGCSEKKTEDKWAAEADQVMELSMTAQQQDGKTVLVITGQDVFQKAEKSLLKVTAMYEAREGEERPGTAEITDYTLALNSTHQLTLTLAADDAAIGYTVAVHKDATKQGRFGEAHISIDALFTEQEGIVARLEGEYAVGDQDPVITVSITGATPAETLDSGMVTLSGLFAGLEITSVTAADQQILIATTGTIQASNTLALGVELSDGALGEAVTVSVGGEALYRTSYIRQDSFMLTAEGVTFQLVLCADATRLVAGDTLTAEKAVFTVTDVAEDRTAITLRLPTSQELDGVIELMTDVRLTIPADKLDSGVALTTVLYGNKASLGAVIDYVQATDKADTYEVTTVVYVKNGHWSEGLTAADLSFGGDLADATVKSVTKVGDAYEAVLTVTAKGIDPELPTLSGTVTVAPNKANNLWGTPVAGQTVPAVYLAAADRDEGAAMIIGFLKDNKDTFGNIKSVGEAVTSLPGVINSVAKATTSILQAMGVVDRTEDDATLNSLRDQIETVQQSIYALDKKLDNIGSTITSGFADTLNAVQINTYVAVSDSWNNFVGTYVVPMQNMLTAYKMAYNEYMLGYINTAHTAQGAVTVYVDANGNLTMPHPVLRGYAVDGQPLVSRNAYRLEEALTGVQEKVLQNGGRLYNGYWDDITAAAKVTGVSAGEYLQSLQVAGALYALNKVGAEEILETYTSFCTALSGQGSNVAMRPLDSYMTMLSMYYNFHIEAKNDIDTTLNWLGSILLESSSLATLAYQNTPGAEEDLVTDAYSTALDRLESAYSVMDRPDYYSYVANKTLKINRVGVFPRYQRVYVWHMVIEAEQGKDLHTDHIHKTQIEEAQEQFQPGSYMTETQLLVVMNRYNYLKQSGVVTAPSFTEYLVSLGVLQRSELVDAGGQPIEVSVLTSPLHKEDLPRDNSITIPVVHVPEGNTFAKVGDMVSVGTGGKLSKKYFDNCAQFKGDTVTLDGQVHNNKMLGATCSYYEMHFYWFNSEYFMATQNTEAGLLIFRLQ